MNNQNISTYQSKRSSSLPVARLSLIALVLFTVIFICLHVLRPDLNPLRHPMSEYALGRYGYLMATGFVLLSVAAGSLLIGLIGARPRSPFTWLGLVALSVFSIGIFSAALYPMDAPGTPLTPTGKVHVVGALVNFVSAFASSLFLALSYRGDSKWKTFFPTAIFLSMGILVSFVLLAITIITNSVIGLANRLLIAFLILWLATTSIRLQSIYKSTTF